MNWLDKLKETIAPVADKPPRDFYTVDKIAEQLDRSTDHVHRLMRKALKNGHVSKIVVRRPTPSGQIRLTPFYGPPDRNNKKAGG